MKKTLSVEIKNKAYEALVQLSGGSNNPDALRRSLCKAIAYYYDEIRKQAAIYMKEKNDSKKSDLEK